MDDGTLVIHDVPIFVECARGDVAFDSDWIRRAVARAKQAERDGYLPPMHVRHHDAVNDATNAVRSAGFFRVTGAVPITYKGTRRTAILADLHITDEYVQREVLQKRLPWRSVEIFDVDEPGIGSLALLDHEAPFLELPLLMVSEVASVSGETIDAAWHVEAQEDGDLVLASVRRGRHEHLLFRHEDTMSSASKKPVKMSGASKTPTPEDAAAAKLKADDGDKKDDDEGDADDEKQEAGMDVGAIVKAIKSGSISVADFDAILAAIQEQKSGAEKQPKDDQQPAPAAVPGGEAMQKDLAIAAAAEAKKTAEVVNMAATTIELAAVKKRLDDRDSAEKCKDDVAAALKRLEGRPLGADIETELREFHVQHGSIAFAALVDTLAKKLGALPRGAAAERFANQSLVPDAAMKFSARGADAVEKAGAFAREWQQLHDTGHTRMSQEHYVEINMTRVGITVESKKTA